MSKERELQHFHLRVKTELEDLKDVLQWFETVIFPSLPQKTGWQCEVALIEAFTNAVRHAHHGLPTNTPIDLEVKLFTNFLEMRIWDRGQPFDLKAKLKANSDISTSPLEKEGGRGLQFMKRLTDELQYLNLPNHRNCLLMRKKYSSEKTSKLDFRQGTFNQASC